MRAHWSEPYLWIHLAGVGLFPITLLLCLLALAIGVPVLPPWLEWLLVAVIGIAPVAWMQWQRPFDIFSILVVALQPAQLTPDQGRILSLLRTPQARLWTLGAALLAAVSLGWLYLLAPIATSLVPLPPCRPLGLGLAAVAFLLSNLFLQVPVSVLQILLLKNAQFQAAIPYPSERVSQDFTILGWQVSQILPVLHGPAQAPASTSAAPIATAAEPPASSSD